MRLFICEYVSGGGVLGMPLPQSLAREGDMMLGALVKDVAAIGGIDIVTTRDARLGHADLPAECHAVEGDEPPWPLWQAIAEEADAVWPIAPETGGALLRFSNLAAAAGRTLLGSAPAAVAVAASKRATADRLAASSVPVVPTMRADDVSQDSLPVGDHGWVLKPDDGAGAESTRLFRRREDLLAALAIVPDLQGWVVQPFIPGTPASLSLICRDGDAWLLSCNRQDVVIDGEIFRYRGSLVGALDSRRAAFEPIAAAVVEAIPGLWGYIGIDLVDAPHGPLVLEVNPRLTTSYVGLGRAIGMNPAELVLRLTSTSIDGLRTSFAVVPGHVEVPALHA